MKKILTVLMGNSLEWYEFSIFIFLGHYITESIGLSQHILFVSLGLLISFLSRPLGAIVYGYLGDKKGRKHVLLASVTIMTLATSLMGILPSGSDYKSLSVTLLFFLRFLQGISGGGEFTTSVTALYEIKKKASVRFVTSLSYSSAQFGFLLGLAVSFVVTALIKSQVLPEYAWRVTFLLSLPVGISIYLLRTKFLELDDGVFELNKSLTSHLRNLFSDYRKAILTVFLMNSYAQLLFYMFSFHILKWSSVCQIDGKCSAAVFFKVAGYLSLLILFIPLSAKGLSNFKNNYVANISSLMALLSCMLLVIAPELNSTKIIFLLSLGALLSCLPEYFASLFPREFRNAGISIPFNVSAALFGGLTPLIFSFFNQLPDEQIFSALYIFFSFLLFYNGLRLMRSTTR